MIRRPTQRMALAWPLALAPLLGACGGGSPAAPGAGLFQRLVLSPSTPAPERPIEPYASIRPPKGLAGWEVECSGGGRLARAPGPRGGPRELVPAVHMKGEGPKVLRIRGRYDPRAFNQVVLQTNLYGKQPELLRVRFEREGRTVTSAPWISVPSRGREAKSVLFDFPLMRRIDGELDELVVEFKGALDLVTVNSVELLAVPPERFLPAPGGAGELVSIAGQQRRAVGLSSRLPLSASFSAPEASGLSFSYGLLASLRVPGERPRLVVSLSSPGLPQVKEHFPMESGRREQGRWRSARLDLTTFTGREVEVRFELEVQGEHEGFCAVAETVVTRRGRQAPSVLFVTSDTHRADHMGQAASESPVSTPHLDQLGARGVFFGDAYAPTNVTNPSHIALMTAKSPRDTRILNNTTPLVERVTTLAERFRDAGYRTFAAVSAYHLLHEESGLGQGFDRLDGPPKGDRVGALTVEALGGWLDDAADEPLFVWLHLFDAHAPYGPPEPFDRRYYQDGRDPFDPQFDLGLPERVVPPSMRRLSDVEFPYQQYRAEVDYVDHLMGRVLARPRFRDGIVAFTADHGEAFGEHGIWWDHAGLYPQTVHVPLVLSWPGGPRGVRCDVPVQTIDIGRTLLDLAGLEDVDFPGRNLTWALEDEPQETPRFVLSAHRFSASVQSGSWLLILHIRKHHETHLEEGREAHAVELYDLAGDPDCLTDLVREPEHYERAKRMRRRLIDWLQTAPAEGLGGSKLLSRHALESLEMMGYGGGDEEPLGEVLYVEDADAQWCRFFQRR